MADSNIPDLPALGATPAAADVLEVYDTSAAVNKKVRYDELGIAAGGITVYRKAFAFDDVGLTDGVEIYTPAIGEVLLDAWPIVTEAWDGTTPRGDIGQFVSGTTGYAVFTAGSFWFMDGLAADVDDGVTAGNASVGAALSALGALSNTANPVVPVVFTSTEPLKFVVSQDGTKGGDDPGASQGAGFVYLVIATPVDL